MLSGVIGWGRDASAVFYYSPFILTPPVLRIRDPVLFWPRDPDLVSGMGKNPDPVWTFQIISPRAFRVKNTEIFWCGSGIRNLFDPVSGMEKFGSGINISDVQHWTPLSFLPVPFFLILFSRLPYCMCMFSPWFFMFFSFYFIFYSGLLFSVLFSTLVLWR